MSQDKKGYSIQLLQAVQAGDLDWIEVTLHFGADPNHPDESGNTAMHYAVQAEDAVAELIIDMLLAKNGEVGRCNKDGKTPIDIADGMDRWELAFKIAASKI